MRASERGDYQHMQIREAMCLLLHSAMLQVRCQPTYDTEMTDLHVIFAVRHFGWRERTARG